MANTVGDIAWTNLNSFKLNHMVLPQCIKSHDKHKVNQKLLLLLHQILGTLCHEMFFLCTGDFRTIIFHNHSSCQSCLCSDLRAQYWRAQYWVCACMLRASKRTVISAATSVSKVSHWFVFYLDWIQKKPFAWCQVFLPSTFYFGLHSLVTRWLDIE